MKRKEITEIEIKKNIRRNLLKFMCENDLSIVKLGELANVSYTCIYNYTTLYRAPKLSTLVKLANALGITIDELIS